MFTYTQHIMHTHMHTYNNHTQIYITHYVHAHIHIYRTHQHTCTHTTKWKQLSRTHSRRVYTTVNGKGWWVGNSRQWKENLQKRDLSAQLARGQLHAYLIPETHMCMHPISAQLRREWAQGLRQENCLLEDEKRGRSLFRVCHGVEEATALRQRFPGLSGLSALHRAAAGLHLQPSRLQFDLQSPSTMRPSSPVHWSHRRQKWPR